ncbi:ureidoglycolate lyase [Tropicimonas sp. IMCC34043]|uniref:ureidoglycolate lyase n=1 Tax=Tropicimonas sp. IMCC34043 TaxID=2248760 RepID=UPI000E25C6A1|nr:ureidoglycolate lyase [Tropicimonas sp. IMCC34043]
MTTLRLPLIAPDRAAFARFGAIVAPPQRIGDRAFFSEHLRHHNSDCAPVFHVNRVAPSALPLAVTSMERHPFAAQVFVPLSVSRYIALVMPSDSSGAPDPAQALAMLMPGSLGIIFNPGVWHLGATVLDEVGSFAVLMWRGGAESDDESCAIPRCDLVEPSSHQPCDVALATGGAEA